MRIYTKKVTCKNGHIKTKENTYANSTCKDCMKENRKNPEFVEKAWANHRKYYKDNYEKCREEGHLRADALKIEVLTHYGPLGILGCCGEGCTVADVDMLSLDHVNNDGAEHRRAIGKNKTGEKMYRLVKNSGFPTGFQTLCMNHQTKKKLENARNNRL